MSTLYESKWLKWGAVLCLAFCLALLLTSPVHAEGETPPEPVPVEEVAASEAPTVPEESLPDEESPPAEILVEESTPPADEVVMVEETSAEPLMEETTQQVSDALALAEESGVTLVESSGDPYFKVGTVKYCFMSSGTCDSSCAYCNGTPGTSGSPTSTPITDAVTAVAGGLLPTDRKIYVESGTYTENVTINGSVTPILGQLKGLIGVDGSTSTILNGYVWADASLNGFTLSGFTINGNGGVSITTATGTVVLKDLVVQNGTGDGFAVYAKGSVEMNGVESSNNAGSGAEIYSYGSIAYTVKITNSEFDDNNGTGNYAGLSVSASGAVTLDGVSASRNRGNGANFTDLKSLTVKNSLFNDNYADPDSSSWGYGLWVYLSTVSPVTLANVMANSNENDNILIFTRGSVTATDIESLDSESGYGDGVYIDNLLGASTATVSITRCVVNDNGDNGLEVYSRGNITLNNIIANLNTNGNIIDNCLESGGVCGGTGSVTLGGVMIGMKVNEFANNGGQGLRVLSKGNVTLNNLDVYDNATEGVYIDNGTGSAIGNVTIGVTVSNWMNGFWGNGDDGLRIESYGNILVSKSVFEDNSGYGAWLNNSGAATPKTVTLSYCSASLNNNEGLRVDASGNVTLSNNYGFEENGGPGVTINTSKGNVSVTASSSSPTSFRENHSHGLYIDAYGTVTLNYVNFWGNWSRGAYINNSSYATIRAVSVLNAEFNNNSSSGLEVYSLGNITLNTVSTSDNQSNGAYLDNCRESGGVCTGTGSITILAPANKTNNFSNNSNIGLEVHSRGNIALTNVTADWNSGNYGAYLKNAYDYLVGTLTYTSSASVTLTATTDQFNSFSWWHNESGLYVESFGNISVARLHADNNDLCGAILINNGAATPKTVSVRDGWFNRNFDDGLRVHASGSILLSGVQAYTNSGQNSMYMDVSGMTLYEYLIIDNLYDYAYFTGDGNTTILTMRSSVFYPRLYVYDNFSGYWYDYNDNDLDFAYVSIPTVSGRTYWIQIHSYTGGGPYLLELNDAGHSNPYDLGIRGLELVSDNGGVTISYSAVSGYGADTGDNSVNGVYIEAKGTVSLSKVTAWHNGVDGVWIDNTSAASSPVTLSYIYTEENGSKGMEIATNGSAAISTGSASYNHQDGLFIATKGTVSVSGLTASGNEGCGTHINNTSAATALGVSLSNSTFNSNQDNGLEVYSKGNISLTNVNASGNSLREGRLDISTHGQTAFEHLGDENWTDEWWFHGSSGGMLVTIEVDSDGSFTPWIEVYNEWGNQQGNHHPSSGSYATYSFNAWDYSYYAIVGGGTGHYDISLNDTPNTYSTPEPLYSGALLDNCQDTGSGCTASGSVAISGSTQKYFSGNNDYGVQIQSKGVVSVSNANANANGYIGLWTDHSQSTGAVTIRSSSATTRSTFSNNTNSGLVVYTLGTITLTNLITYGNGQYGAELDNSTSSTAMSISISNSRFGYNSLDGLNAHASGAISLFDVWANGNSQIGAKLVNYDVSAIQPVTVKKSVVNGNTQSGLVVWSRGAITIDNLTAQGNDYGAILDNSWSGATGGVVITGAFGENRFEHNTKTGLIASSGKAITATKIVAEWNGSRGVYLDNYALGVGSGNVTLTNAKLRYNDYEGLFVETNGWINLNLVSGISNGLVSSVYNDGAYLILHNAYTSSIGYPVSILNSVFQGNWGSGIEIQLPLASTKGSYLYNTSYMGNDVNGTGWADRNLKIVYY
jgi:hypothetical protein